MDYRKRLEEKFRCAKCNNHTCISKEVSLSRVSEKILGNPRDKYLLISCSLCGYTEVYNLKVIAHAEEGESAINGVPEPRQG